jgi:NAD(P)-dependent dehydrogenase (short-subunit alcohol dehydrogenase family)
MAAASTPKTIVLITGANQGIGLATARKLATEPNYHVIIGSRNVGAGIEAAKLISSENQLADVSSLQLDLNSDASIIAAVQAISATHGRLDVLINNAGVLLDLDTSVPGLSTRELFTQTFFTNVIGTACLTEACLPLLRKSNLPKVIFVSSRMGSLQEGLNTKMPFFDVDIKAYDSSKAAVNMLALNYKRLLADKGGLVNAVCPKLISTKLTSMHPDGAPPEVGAQRIVELATDREGGVNGTFSDQDGVIPW